MQINAVTIACIYSFCQQYELVIFSFEQGNIIFENIFLQASLIEQIYNFWKIIDSDLKDRLYWNT